MWRELSRIAGSDASAKTTTADSMDADTLIGSTTARDVLDELVSMAAGSIAGSSLFRYPAVDSFAADG